MYKYVCCESASSVTVLALCVYIMAYKKLIRTLARVAQTRFRPLNPSALGTAKKCHKK